MAAFKYDIWRLQAQSDVRGLLEAMKSSDASMRKRAATALRALGASSAIPALQTHLATEGDPDVRQVVMATLDYLFQQELDEDEGDTQAAVPDDAASQVMRLIAQLGSNKADAIISAAQTLGDLKAKMAAEPLVMLFHNQNMPPQVRLAAAESLIKLESAPVEVTLLAALRHPDWHVRRNAAAVLGQLSADWAVEPLAKALVDEHELIRKTAEAALKRIDTVEALQVLERMQAAPPPPPQVPVPAEMKRSTATMEQTPATAPVSEPPAPPVEAKRKTGSLPKTAKLPSTRKFGEPPRDDEDTQPTVPVADDVS